MKAAFNSQARKRPVDLILNEDLVVQVRGLTNKLSGVVELLLADYLAHAARNPDAMEIARKCLLRRMVVQQSALAEDDTLRACHAKRICIALQSVIGRRHRNVEVECVGLSRDDAGGNHIGMLLYGCIGGPGRP